MDLSRGLEKKVQKKKGVPPLFYEFWENYSSAVRWKVHVAKSPREGSGRPAYMSAPPLQQIPSSSTRYFLFASSPARRILRGKSAGTACTVIPTK